MLTAAQVDMLHACYPVVADLPATLQAALRRDALSLQAVPGQLLFNVRDACSHYLMVLDGAVRVTRPTAGGRELVLYRVQPGDSCILTVSCLLGRAVYPASGVAEGDLSGVLISHEWFDQLIAGQPRFRRFVFSFFAQRMTRLMTLIESVAFHRLDQRLADFLLREGPVLQVTHQMIADELGSVREVVSRLLKDLESQALVSLERGQIQVIDPGGLAVIASPLPDLGA